MIMIIITIIIIIIIIIIITIIIVIIINLTKFKGNTVITSISITVGFFSFTPRSCREGYLISSHVAAGSGT
jgi:hypothetical protein